MLQVNRKVVEGHSAAKGIYDSLGLLVNLLQHEVLELPLGCGERVVGHVKGRFFQLIAIQVRIPDILLGDDDHLARTQVDYLPRVGQQRRKIAGQQHLVFTVADDDASGVPQLEGYDLVRLPPGYHNYGVGAAQAIGGRPHSILQGVLILQVGLNEMRNTLGVCLGRKGVAFSHQLLL